MSRSDQSGAISELRSRTRQFFHAEEVPYGLAIVRILLPLAMLLPMLQRWPHIRELYSLDGAPLPLSIGYGYGDMLPFLPAGPAVALYSAMLFFLFAGSLGWHTRLSLILGTSLYTYFNFLDGVSTITKYSVIAVDVMIVLSLSNCGAIWSVDSRRKQLSRRGSWPGEPALIRPRYAVWPRRLGQFLIASVYFGAAITKIHTHAFFSGDQLRFWMLSNLNFDNPLGNYFAMNPALLIISAYITIVWEMAFLFLCWRGWSRIIMLIIGAGFHLMTCLTLGLYIFPMICLSIYFCFLEESDVRQIAASWRRLKRRRTWLANWQAPRWTAPAISWIPDSLQFSSPALFGLLVLLISTVSIEAEHQLDPYSTRRAAGPLPLRQMDTQVALSMINGDRPIREADKFFSFETGTTVIGGNLANHRSAFQPGERVLVQCNLNPPHEDLWVECNLHDAAGRLIERNGSVVTRENLRCNFYYDLTLEPGEYELVLKSSGIEISRRQITLLGNGSAPLAN